MMIPHVIVDIFSYIIYSFLKKRKDSVMDYLDRVSLDTPLRIFIRDLWFRQSQEENCQSKKATVFKTLLSNGCDYYELLALYSNFPLTPDDGEILGEYAPIPTHTFPVSLKNIRFALPHWTPSRYHTAPISKVLEEIQEHLLRGKPLIKVYNSNLNPKKQKAYNDRYILLSSSAKSLLIDLNRRTTIQVQHQP